MLMGVLLIALWLAANDYVVLGGIVFACVLNLKHLFLCVAPVYACYGLRRCFANFSARDLSIGAAPPGEIPTQIVSC